MKFITVSTLVAVALCSLVLVNTALGESNLLKVLKDGGGIGQGYGSHGSGRADVCVRNKHVFHWHQGYYKAENGRTGGAYYINPDKLTLSPDGSRTQYKFNCRLPAFKNTLHCKYASINADPNRCRKCQFTRATQWMMGGKLSDKNKDGKTKVTLIVNCELKDIRPFGKFKGKDFVAKYTYRVEDNRSRRRRLLGMKHADGDCRL